jgi:hypothetical protein
MAHMLIAAAAKIFLPILTRSNSVPQQFRACRVHVIEVYHL